MNKWILYQDNEFCNTKIDNFFKLPNLPDFVSSRKSLKIDQILADTDSRFWMLTDKENRMIGCCGILVTKDQNGIRYAKYPYRQFIFNNRSLASHIFNIQFELDLMQNWRENHLTIPTVTTINKGNERILFYAMKRIQRFAYNYKPFYLKFNKNLHLQPNYVLEMNTWQLALTSKEYKNFERPTSNLDTEFKHKIESLWNQGYWYGQNGRTLLK